MTDIVTLTNNETREDITTVDKVQTSKDRRQRHDRRQQKTEYFVTSEFASQVIGQLTEPADKRFPLPAKQGVYTAIASDNENRTLISA